MAAASTLPELFQAQTYTSRQQQRSAAIQGHGSGRLRGRPASRWRLGQYRGITAGEQQTNGQSPAENRVSVFHQ